MTFLLIVLVSIYVYNIYSECHFHHMFVQNFALPCLPPKKNGKKIN